MNGLVPEIWRFINACNNNNNNCVLVLRLIAYKGFCYTLIVLEIHTSNKHEHILHFLQTVNNSEPNYI